MSTVASFAAVGFGLYAAHHVADHWVQTQHQADTKGQPGRDGRIACAAHVSTYTITAIGALLLISAYTDISLNIWSTIVGLTISGVTHYIADRRTPLRRIAEWLGSGEFYRLNAAGMNGAYLLDQSWHVGWLFIAALVIASGVPGLILTVGITAAAGIGIGIAVATGRSFTTVEDRTEVTS